MPKRDELLAALAGDHDVGVLLVAQMGGVPQELQLVIQTATYDEAVQGLREKAPYIVRVLGVREHRVSLGVFANLFFADEHPILHHYNEPMFQIDFKGRPADPNALVLDIQTAWGATFGPWRDIAEDVNREKPLFDLLQMGGGTLGTMPKPAAERMGRVLRHHEMETTLTEVDQGRDGADEHGRERKMKLLGIDDSYFIAYEFSVDEMQARKGDGA